MRTTIATAALTAIMFSTSASAEATDKRKLEVCKTFSEVARHIMIERQYEVPRSKLFEDFKASRIPGADPHAIRLFVDLVTDAYEWPTFGPGDFRKRMIDGFADDAETRCREMFNYSG